MSYVDLITAAQDAVFAALAPIASNTTMPAGTQVLQHVPEGVLPPFVRIGHVTSENQTDMDDEQHELITVEVHSIYRGEARRGLLKMMAAVRTALQGQPIAAAGAGFETPCFVKAEAGAAISDGVTYVGLSIFKFHAWPG